jgi:hypothetical protein
MYASYMSPLAEPGPMATGTAALCTDWLGGRSLESLQSLLKHIVGGSHRRNLAPLVVFSMFVLIKCDNLQIRN